MVSPLAITGHLQLESLTIVTFCTTPSEKKADVVEYLIVFNHVGLLVNGPPGTAELPSTRSSDNFHHHCADRNGEGKENVVASGSSLAHFRPRLTRRSNDSRLIGAITRHDPRSCTCPVRSLRRATGRARTPPRPGTSGGRR